MHVRFLILWTAGSACPFTRALIHANVRHSVMIVVVVDVVDVVVVVVVVDW